MVGTEEPFLSPIPDVPLKVYFNDNIKSLLEDYHKSLNENDINLLQAII